MSEAQGEICIIDIKQEMPANHPGRNEVPHTDFSTASSNDLVSLRNASVQIHEAEKVHKEASLELFFRIHGDEYRSEYNKWLMIKKRKEQDWEQQMFAKYGPEWRGQITESDKERLVYTSADLEAYEQHKDIEEKALLLQENDSNKLLEKEKEEAGRGSKGDFFKLVRARTLTDFPFLTEKEVHRAVYSSDFLFFYLRLITHADVKKGINQIQGKELPEGMDFEDKVNQSAVFVKELAIFGPVRQRHTLQNLMQAA